MEIQLEGDFFQLTEPVAEADLVQDLLRHNQDTGSLLGVHKVPHWYTGLSSSEALGPGAYLALVSLCPWVWL